MKLNPDIKLQKIGSMHMLVNIGDDKGQDLTEVYNLNDTAAFLWEKIGTGEFDIPTLAEWLCEEYEVPHEQAEKDSRELASQWERLGLILK